MDKQGRLTRIGEWKVGMRVQWLKGREFGRTYSCVRVGGRIEYDAVWLESEVSRKTVLYFKGQWTGRFVPLQEIKGSP